MENALGSSMDAIGTVSPWGVIALGIVSIWRGWWIARPIHEAIVNAALANVEKERVRADKAEEARDLLQEQLMKYMREDSLALAALTGIREEARKS